MSAVSNVLACTCLGAAEGALLPQVLRAAELASVLGIRLLVTTFAPLPAAAHESLTDAGAL
eukprot:5964305-Prymnesium_polylepis.1